MDGLEVLMLLMSRCMSEESSFQGIKEPEWKKTQISNP